MAEEIVLLEDDKNTEEESSIPKKEKFDKKIILIIILIVLILILLIVAILLIPKKKPKKVEEVVPPKVEILSQKFESKKLDQMINHANTLYASGDKKAALKLYEDIAFYSQTLSNYNLGVSQMKQKNYKLALQSFDKALQNKENITPSAINAAVCSLHLNDTEKFKYYIEYARVFLDNEANNPLYDYYLGLINYYQGFYVEAYEALSLEKHNDYEDDAMYTMAKILANYGEFEQSKKFLLKQKSYDTSISLGFLEAKMGNFVKAKYYLNEATKMVKDPAFINYSIALIDAKIGNYDETSDILKYIRATKGDQFLNTLDRIIVKLNKELFDQNLSQKNYDKDFFKTKKDKYDILFHFTPYKVFDAKSAMDLINKASVGLYLDDTSTADSFLKSSKNISKVNITLTKAIEDALNYNIVESNKKLKDLVKTYSQHSILHFDLALSYAYLGKYDVARKHFVTSYHLNPKEHLAGIYALMCGDILGIEQTKFENNFVDNLSFSQEDDDYKFYKALYSLYKNDISGTLDYVENNVDDNILENVLKIIISYQIDRSDILNVYLNKLKDRLKDDVMVNMLYFALTENSTNSKQYAKNVQLYFLKNDLNILSLFSGTSFISKRYTKLMQQAGLLHQERIRLKNMLKTSPKLQVGILQALAYISIYSGDFEEAYAIYNTLIDEYKVKDSNTLFLASVASIGAGHNNSAIALLELSRIDDPNNKEARLALALLYLQEQNYESAIFQFGKVGKFESEFFSFDINHKKEKDDIKDTSN